MRKKFVITVMLGMNRFGGKDIDHPFDMSCLDGVNVIWLPKISKIEKTHSTPVYEVGRLINEFIAEFNSDCAEIDKVVKSDFFVIVGRGTIGSGSEENLAEELLEAKKKYGRNSYNVIYSKSYGVIDTLRALAILKEEKSKMVIDLMFCIDGYAPAASKLSVSNMCDNENDERERVLTVPKNVKKAYGIVQRTDGFKGFRVGRLNAQNRWNHIIKQKDIGECYYQEYSDGYKRRLNVSHFNMEEIVATIPCCSYGGRMYTVNELIKFLFRKYKDGKMC